MKLTIESKSRAVLHTAATARALVAAAGLEGRRTWLKGGGLSFEPTEHNIERLEEVLGPLDREHTGEILRSPSRADESAFEAPTLQPVQDVGPGGAPWRSRTEPYPHQRAADAKMAGRRVFALLMEQGTGKTLNAIEHATKLFLDGQIKAVLVVAPKGVHRQWIENQLPAHCGVGWVGSYWGGKDTIAEINQGEPFLEWHSINIDAIKTPRGLDWCMDFIIANDGQVLMIMDESHLIKNVRSARWKAANVLGQMCSHRLMMTGTVVAKDLTDEWAQLKWLDERILGIRYITAFRAEYCVMGGFEGKVVVGHRNVERFRAKVDPHTFRATKEQIGILPKQYSQWSFDLTPMQKRLIREIKQDYLAQIDSGAITSAQNAAVAFLRIQQIANGFIMDEEQNIQLLFESELGNPRIQALVECIEQLDGPVVIWARFREDIRQIHMALVELGHDCVVYTGGTNTALRSEAVKRFASGKARFFISNPQAGGTGVDGLQNSGCRNAIYYSNSDNSIDRWQSEDRIHRIGTVGGVTYWDLVAKGSTDARQLHRLRHKESIAQLALGDIREILREDL